MIPASDNKTRLYKHLLQQAAPFVSHVIDHQIDDHYDGYVATITSMDLIAHDYLDSVGTKWIFDHDRGSHHNGYGMPEDDNDKISDDDDRDELSPEEREQHIRTKVRSMIFGAMQDAGNLYCQRTASPSANKIRWEQILFSVEERRYQNELQAGNVVDNFLNNAKGASR